MIEDPPLAAVQRGLWDLNVETVHIDQRRISGYFYELAIQDSALVGCIRSEDNAFRLEDVKAIYLRPYDWSQLEEFADIDSYSEKWAAAARFEDAITLWCEMADAEVVNRPSAMDSNNSKPYQLSMISDCGFAIPDTIITTDPEAVIAFWRKHHNVVYKSISSRRSIVTRLNAGDLDRLDEVASCPTQFQRFIEGTDYRVHVLGNQVFASKVVSSSDDYRYSADTKTTAATIPAHIAAKCIFITNKLGLLFSGIDLREALDGEWFCFEVNTCPGYTSFEDQAPQITKALVKLLAQD